MHVNDSFPTNSTYRAPITVVDENGDPKTNIESVEYMITSEEDGGEVYFEATHADSEITIGHDGDANVVEVLIDAADVDWTGVVHEEMRATLDTGVSAVPLKRDVAFHDVNTKHP